MQEGLPKKTEKPWGYELLFALTDKYAGKVMFVKKGRRLSLQYHNIKEETMYVQQGKLLMEMGEDGSMVKNEVSAGACFHVTPLTRHRMTALEDSFIFEVSTPELDDVIRLADDYGRTSEDKL